MKIILRTSCATSSPPGGEPRLPHGGIVRANGSREPRRDGRLTIVPLRTGKNGKRAKIDVTHPHGGKRNGRLARRRRDFATPLGPASARPTRHGDNAQTRGRTEQHTVRRSYRTTVYSRARCARAPRIIALSRHDFRVTNARPGCTRMTDDAPSRRHFACARARPRRAGNGRAAGRGGSNVPRTFNSNPPPFSDVQSILQSSPCSPGGAPRFASNFRSLSIYFTFYFVF